MRRIDSMIPQALADDVFGQTACKAMRRILEIGWQKWIEEELVCPSSSDNDWCRMILALSQGQEAKFEEERTFRCPKCRDTGSIVCVPAKMYGSIYQVGKRCEPCAWRIHAKAEWEARQEVETGRRRRGRLDDLMAD